MAHNFRIGEQVVCVSAGLQFEHDHRPWWKRLFKLPPPIGPKVGEIVTIHGFWPNGYLVLKEYLTKQPGGGVGVFRPSCFRRLSDMIDHNADEEIKRLLADVPDVITEPA